MSARDDHYRQQFGRAAFNAGARQVGSSAAALIVVGVLTIAGASIITTRMTAAVEHAGAASAEHLRPAGSTALDRAPVLVFGGLPSSCGGRVPAVDAVTALYPVVDPAGFFDNDDPALGGTARDMAGAYTGGSPRQFPQRYAAITSVTHISGARQHRPADLPPVDGAMAAIPRPGALSH